MRLRAPDLWTGLALIALAGLYYAAAITIPDSMLSDEVGAAGLPKLLAAALAASGALLAVRSQTGTPFRVTLAVEPRAAGLIAAMAVYIVLLPLAGYPIVLAALIVGVALLAGARPTLTLAAISILAGGGLWYVFVRLFHIGMPAGILAGRL